MKFTPTAVVITFSVVIVNLGGIYTPNVTPGPGLIYIVAERNPANNGDTASSGGSRGGSQGAMDLPFLAIMSSN